MQYTFHEEREMDFKEPLHSDRGSSAGSGPPHYPDHARPPLRVSATFGLMGEVGIGISIILFLIDILTDLLLVVAIWKQATEEPNYYKKKQERIWFLMTLSIVFVPLAISNLLSLLWYAQNKEILGVNGIFYRKNPCEKMTCIIAHILLLGSLVRYFDILKYGKKIKKYFVEVDIGSRGSIQRLTPKGEVNSALQMVISKETALLDIIHSFLKNCPQLILQIFLLYRNPMIATENINMVQLTQAAQILKILVGLFAISWCVTSYQDELRRAIPGKKQLTCGAASTCLLWRFCLIASRIIAIGSFASLKVNGEGGLIKVSTDYSSTGSIMSFPFITTVILLGHFLVMVVWLCAQKTTFCNTYEGQSRPVWEVLYNILMGWVHVFSYINMKDTPSRRRIIFFYLILFVENTAFILIWYLQLISKELWLRVSVVFLVEALYVMGLSSTIGYYSFLHPDRNDVRQLHAAWKT